MSENSSITQKESTAIYSLRAFAILSVIAAHVCQISEASAIRSYITSFMVLFGQVGVICFLIIGGFLYYRAPSDDKRFWKRKFTSLIIPWIFCATVTYLYRLCGGFPLLIEDYIKWVLGSGSWYYYITVYLFLLFTFKYIYQNDLLIYGSILLTLVSLFLKAIGVKLELPAFFTDYLNPFFWVGFFALGVLIRRKAWHKTFLKNKMPVAVALLMMAISAAVLHQYRIFTYFHIASVVFELSTCYILMRIAFWIAKFSVASHVAEIGNATYCIYLLHMYIVQAIDRHLPDNVLFDLLSPLIGLAAMMVLIIIGKAICKRLPFGEKVCQLVGLRL